MSVEENKAVINGLWKALNRPDWETQARPYMPEAAAWKWFLPAHRSFREAFPDFHGKIEGIVGEDERVAVWAKITGTFTNPYDQGGMAGIEPKEQKLEWAEFYVYDFSKGGPHVIYWGIDELGRLRQLGAIS